MIDDSPIDRRTVLRGIGTVALAGVLAGCGGDGSAGDDGDGSDGSDGDSGDDSNGDSGDDSDGDSSDGGVSDGGGSDGGGSNGVDGGGGGVPAEVEDYLSNDGSFDGVEDVTGQDEVTVTNGAEGNDGNFAFGPSAIRVDAGTTVVWEWTGKGGQHNVADEDGAFKSDLSAKEGNTFEQTFDESGVTLYYCEPHKMLGMKGAIIVE